jgi:signal transduction histidine kinase
MMRVGQRLFVAVIPAVLGVLAMAGLAYWGQRGREIPEGLLVAGIVAAVASLGLAWHNTRYVARRIDALSRHRAAPDEGGPSEDELDSIERRIVESERRGETRQQAAEALVREYAGLLADASATMGRKLDEVRMPLHILLSSPFGELNENQEEMIGAAQQAAEDADEARRFIGRIVDLDAGRVEAHPEPIRPRDLLQPVFAAVEPRLLQAGAGMDVDLPPNLPHVYVDPRHTREALSLILDRVAGQVLHGSSVRITAESRDAFVHLCIQDASLLADPALPLLLRLLHMQGGTIATREASILEIRLPAAA